MNLIKMVLLVAISKKEQRSTNFSSSSLTSQLNLLFYFISELFLSLHRVCIKVNKLIIILKSLLDDLNVHSSSDSPSHVALGEHRISPFSFPRSSKLWPAKKKQKNRLDLCLVLTKHVKSNIHVWGGDNLIFWVN